MSEGPRCSGERPLPSLPGAPSGPAFGLPGKGASPVERGSESGTELVTMFQPSLAFSGDKTHPFVFSLVELRFYNLQLKEHYWSKKMFLLTLLFAYRLALPGSL